MLTIRHAVRSDMSELINLLKAHAAFEGAQFKDSDSLRLRLVSLLFERTKITCMVAEREKRLIGYTTFMQQYATWHAKAYLYMDCLFLKKEARGLGVGSALMKKVVEEMRNKNLSEIQWQTPSFNTGAISFYAKLGAKKYSKSRFIWNP